MTFMDVVSNWRSPSPTHAYAYRTKCENVETKAGIIRNQARRFSTDLDQRRCPSEERKRLTGSFLACINRYKIL